MSALEYRNGASIRGGVTQDEHGWHWVLKVDIEGLDNFILISSARSGTYFSTEERALEELEKAGYDVANQIADVLKPVEAEGFVDIIDRNKIN